MSCWAYVNIGHYCEQKKILKTEKKDATLIKCNNVHYGQTLPFFVSSEMLQEIPLKIKVLPSFANYMFSVAFKIMASFPSGLQPMLVKDLFKYR